MLFTTNGLLPIIVSVIELSVKESYTSVCLWFKLNEKVLVSISTLKFFSSKFAENNLLNLVLICFGIYTVLLPKNVNSSKVEQFLNYSLGHLQTKYIIENALYDIKTPSLNKIKLIK